jgi:hypothetical protein
MKKGREKQSGCRLLLGVPLHKRNQETIKCSTQQILISRFTARGVKTLGYGVSNLTSFFVSLSVSRCSTLSLLSLHFWS